MKAFWFTVCPIVFVSSGPVSSNDVLCQVSGFFLTSAIEAADISVLIIAIHSAICIFKPHQSGGKTGLYAYRRYAYTFWCLVPIILASVVPLTGHRFAYNGLYCYLPVEPKWYRMALSWIPRYIVLGVIFFVYAWVYIYVGCRFRRLKRDQRRASTQTSISSYKLRRSQPPSPTMETSPELREVRDRQQSVASDMSIVKPNDKGPLLAVSPEGVAWNWSKSSHDDNQQTSSRRQEPSPGPISPTSISFSSDVSNLLPPPPARSGSTRVAPPRPTANDHPDSRPSWRQALSFTGDKPPNVTTTTLGARPPLSPTASSVERSHSTPSVHLIQPLTNDTLRASRNRMRRQLRLLFLYPLIYVIAWVAPFVSQIYRYGDDALLVQPYPLLVASIASLCIGAAVDCCFFSIWDQPWRHLEGGFWQGLVMRFRIGLNRKDGGRTKEERIRDTMWALDRRVQENAERERRAAAKRISTAQRPREWWDLEEDDNRASASVS